MLVDIEDIVKRQVSYSLAVSADAATTAAAGGVGKRAKKSTTSSTSVLDIAPPVSDVYIKSFRESLLAWFHKHRRKMPWRGDDTAIQISPYGVWVSEVMLQQTRVETVIEYWLRWMDRFPTVSVLARSSSDEVNQLWAGLGYYRRARNLLLGAQYVEKHYNGVLPSDKEELLKIPGIGPYTAGAISSIAYNAANSVVDGNVHRVFSRLFALQHPIGGGKMEKICWSLADTLVDPVQPGAFNQAVMELGATVCKPTNPDCAACPVRDFCAAKTLTAYVAEQSSNFIYHNIITPNFVDLAGNETAAYKAIDAIPTAITFFPQKVSKKKSKEVFLLIHAVRTMSHMAVLKPTEESSSAYKYLFVRRPDKGLLASQWELPNVAIASPLLAVEKESDGEEAEGEGEAEGEVEISLKDVDVMSLYDTNHPVLKKYFVDRCGALWLSPSSGSSVGVDAADGKATMLFESKQSVKALSEPIVHIFSHERHTMLVVVEDVHALCIDATAEKLFSEQFRDDLCWRTVQEMHEAGITTGCKKVLKAIEQGLHHPKGNKPTKRKLAEDSNNAATNQQKQSQLKRTAINTDNDAVIDLSAEQETVPTTKSKTSKSSTAEKKKNTISKYFQKKA